jgi:hypothetical protein
LKKAHYVITAVRCIPGILDIDAFEPPGGRTNHRATGFRTLSKLLQKMCSGMTGDWVSADDTSGYIIKSTCSDVMDTVTSQGAGFGRDRSLPKLLQQGLMGWKLLHDEQLERQVVLFPDARKSKNAVFRTLASRESRIPPEVALQSIRLHVIDPLIMMGRENGVDESVFDGYLVDTVQLILLLFDDTALAAAKAMAVFWEALRDGVGRPSRWHGKALRNAVARNSIETARFLMDERLGDDRARPSDANSVALRTAVEQNNLEMAHLMLDERLGDDDRARPSVASSVALRVAIGKNNLKMAHLLLDDRFGEYRARPSDYRGDALQMAVEQNNLEMARLLLDDRFGEYRARPSDRDSEALRSAAA